MQLNLVNIHVRLLITVITIYRHSSATPIKNQYVIRVNTSSATLPELYLSNRKLRLNYSEISTLHLPLSIYYLVQASQETKVRSLELLNVYID